MALLQQNLIVERKDQEMLYFKFRRTQIQRMKPKEIFYTVSLKALCELHFFSFWWKSSNFDENNQKKVFLVLIGRRQKNYLWGEKIPSQLHSEWINQLATSSIIWSHKRAFLTFFMIELLGRIVHWKCRMSNLRWMYLFDINVPYVYNTSKPNIEYSFARFYKASLKIWH